MPNLELDINIAIEAQNYADKLNEEFSSYEGYFELAHSPEGDRPNCGENIYKYDGDDVGELKFSDLPTQAWYEEMEYYDFRDLEYNMPEYTRYFT